MSHRFTPTLLCALALAAFPAAAAAQSPPDERANARAFADVGIRLDAEETGAFSDDVDFFTGDSCKAERRLSKATSRQQGRAISLVVGQMFGIVGRALTPPLDRAMADLNAVPTADPALIGGREAWGQIARVYRRGAAFKHIGLCRELRIYVRGGFKTTPAIRRANKMLRAIDRLLTADIETNLSAAV